MKLSKRIALALVPLWLLSLGLFPSASVAATTEILRTAQCSPNNSPSNVTMNVGDTLIISTTGCRGAGVGGANAGAWSYGLNGIEIEGAFPGNYSFNPGDKVSFVATTKNTTNATGITLWSGPGTTGTQGPQILITVNDPTPPTLSSSTPADDATGVAVSSNIVLNFSESVKAGTGNILLKKSSDNSTFATIPINNAQIAISGSTVTINPTADLDNSTGYYIEIASGVIQDLSNNAFAGITSPSTLNFTTVAETTPPTLSSSTPADDATGVAVSSNIVLNFSESVKAGTGNILLKKSSDNTTYATIPISDAQITISGSTVTINPTADLDTSTGYYIEIASGVIQDLSNNAFAGITSPSTLNFTTVAETTPPTNNGSSGNGSSPSVAPLVSPPVSPPNVTPRGGRSFSTPSRTASDPAPALRNQYDLDAGPRALVEGQLTPLATTRSPNGGIAVATPQLQFEMRPTGSMQISSSPAPRRPTDVILSRGQSAMVSGGGFAPGSSVRLSLEGVTGQGLRELAQISVNGEGKFDTDLQFDARGAESPVPIGRHGLQVVGVDREGNETLLNLTIAISQGDPEPEPNRTRGALPALSLGQSLATSAGIPDTVKIEAISEAREVSVLSGTWRFTLNLDNDGGSVEQSDQGATMIWALSQTTTVSGEGFQPDTRVDVWLFSDPSLLGSVTVTGDGTFSGEFSIDPSFVPPGEHTLQLQGVGTDGFIKAANLGVLVQDSQTVESTNPLNLIVWAIVALAVAAVVVLVALMIRNRRRN